MYRENGNIEQAGMVAAVDQTADGIVIADTEGKIQYVNPAFTAMTGYSSEEAVGQYPRILKSGCEPAEFYAELWTTIRSGRVWHGELTNRRKDGTFYREEMRITPVRDSKGEIASYIAIKHDVTERGAAEESQRFLAAIVESSKDAIAAYSPAGIILTWNRGAEAIFGYIARDAIGKHVSMLTERPAGLAHFTEQVLQGKVVSQYEGRCRRKDGRTVHVSVTGSPIRNAAGELVAISVVLRDISERKEAEQARALLASIVEFSDEAIHAVSLDGTIVSWNRGAEILFGYSSQEIIGQNLAILAPPGAGEEVRQFLWAIQSGFSVCPFERVLRGKDGRPLNVQVSISPIRDPDGQVVGVAGIARDIRSRVRAERQLRQSEELFREVFANAPFGMCVSGLDGRIMQANAALCRMLGYSEQELLGTAWADLTHLDDVEPCLRMKEQMLREPDGCLEAEKRYIHKSGSVVFARIKASMGREQGGNPAYHVVHVEDITERKRALEALHESEERFRLIADSCPSMMWVTDAEGGHTFINRAYREFCGATLEDVEGGRWQILIHPDDAPEYIAAFERAMREHTPFRAEARVRRFDGEWRWFGSYAAARLSPGGEYRARRPQFGHHRAQESGTGAAGQRGEIPPVRGKHSRSLLDDAPQPTKSFT